MPIFPGKLFLQGDNSGSFPIVESQHSRGTTFIIDNFSSASLAKLGSGVTGTAGLRELGSIVFDKNKKRYYVYSPSVFDPDTNISGSSWTTTSNWKEIVTQVSSGGIGTTDALFNHITASGNISASGIVVASRFQSAGGSGELINFNDNLSIIGNVTASGDISASGLINGLSGSFHNVSILDSNAGANPRLKVGRTSNQSIDFSVIDLNNTITANQDADSDGDHKFILDREFDGSGANDFIIRKGGSDQLLINTSGNVGIGTTAPTKALQVEGEISSSGIIYGGKTSFPQLQLSDDGFNDKLNIGMSNDIAYFKTSDTSNDFKFRRSDNFDIMEMDMSAEMTHISGGLNVRGPKGHITASGDISASGDLILGGKIEIDGGGGLSDAIIEVSSDTLRLKDKGNVNVIIDSDGSSANGEFRVRAHSGEVTRLIVSSSGNVGIGTSTPGEALEVVGNISSSLTGSFGKMTIGTSTPDHRNTQLTVKGGVSGSPIALFERTLGGTGEVAINMNSSDPQVRFYEGSDFAAIGQDSTNSNLVFATGSIVKDKEAMVINTDGEVGIGTTSPIAILHTNTSTNVVGRFQSSTDDSKIIIQDNDTTGYHNVRDGYHSFGFDGFTTRAALFVVSGSEDANGVHGKVGIGTSNPQAPLHVIGNISGSADIDLYGNPSTINFVTPDESNAYIKGSTSALDLVHSQGQYEAGIRLDTQGNIKFASDHNGGLDFSNTHMIISHSVSDGNAFVGIGTTSPSAKLTINGDVAISASGDIDIANEKRIKFAASDGTYSDDGSIRRASGEAIRFRYDKNSLIFDATENDDFEVRNSSDAPVFDLKTGNGTSYFSGSAGKFFNLEHNTGDIGIGAGASNPTHNLHIKPSSGTSQIKIESDANHAELLIDAHTGYDPNVEFQEAGATKWVVGVDTSNSDLFHIGTSSIVPNDSKFVINTSGQVGIGTKSPTLGRLHISGSGNGSNRYAALFQSTGSITYLKFASSATGIAASDGFDIGANSSTAYLINRENASMIFSTNNTERVRIKNDGKVGIGTTSPNMKLSVDGDISASGMYITSSTGLVLERAGHEKVALQVANSDRFQIRNQNDNRNDLVILDSGEVGIGGIDKPTKTLTVAGDISASGDASIGTAVNQSAVNAYGTLQVNQNADNDESGIGIQNRLNGRSLRIYVDSSNNSVLNSGDGGGQPLILNEGVGKVGIGISTPTKELQVEGDISASNLFVGGGNVYLQQNNTGDNFIKYDSTNDHIEITTQDIQLKANNAIGIGTAGDKPATLFKHSGTALSTGHLVNITGSKTGEFHFSHNSIGGGSGTDLISGSTIGAIAFSGRTEFKQGSAYNPFNQTGGVGNDDDTRLLAHIRGGTEVDYFLVKADTTGDGNPDTNTIFSKTGGFLSFHTARDSRSYAGNHSYGDNEKMRIDRNGNVGIGFQNIDHKLVVENGVAISSSVFTRNTLGPSLTFKGLRSGSTGDDAGGPELAGFILTQGKIGSLPNQSSSFEIRATQLTSSVPLDNAQGFGSQDDLIAMHIRTHGHSNIQTSADLLSTGSAFESIPHKGANFGFNMNNPDGFNINTQQTTFGLGTNDGDFVENRLNFRGNTQFRFEGHFYQSENLGALDAFGGQLDFDDYIYDIDPPDPDDEPGTGTDDGEGTVYDTEIQVNPPHMGFTEWRNPDTDELVPFGNFREVPLGWQWSFNQRLSEEISFNNLRYSATGSLVSGALDNTADNDLYTLSQSCWSASFARPPQVDNFKYTLEEGMDGIFRCKFTAQASASHEPANRFPTFPNNGDFLVNGESYKWKIELNKISGPGGAPANLQATSSRPFKYYNLNNVVPEILMGDVNGDGLVNMADIITIINSILGNITLTPEQIFRADMNGDGMINIQDISAILDEILNLIEDEHERSDNRGYNVNTNKVFLERKIERDIFSTFNLELSSSGVRIIGTGDATGSNSEVTSSMRSFITSSSNYLQSGSRVTSFSNPYLRRVKPKIEEGYGFNYIENIKNSQNNLNGVVEGSTLLFDNSITRNVEEVFITSSTDLGSNKTLWVKLDSALPSNTISGSFYKQFKPKGIGLSNTPVFRNRGKVLRKNKGVLIRPDGKIGIGTSKPEALLHISASSTGSAGVVNDTLFKIQTTNGSEFKITETEQVFKDKSGNISRRKFNSLGKEVFLSGSGDTTAADNNAITFDQTGDSAIITLSGSQASNTKLNLVGNNSLGKTEFFQITPKFMQFTSVGVLTPRFGFYQQTSSGQMNISPRSTFTEEVGITISGSGDIGIQSPAQDGHALTVGGTISASALILSGGSTAFTSASLASAIAGGGGGSSADNLGNHTATQDLNLGGNDIFGVQHITASGDISASDDMFADKFVVAGTTGFSHLGGGSVLTLGVSDTPLTILSKTVQVSNNITASSDISSSATIKALAFTSAEKNVATFADGAKMVYGSTGVPSHFASDITASNNISASGYVTATDGNFFGTLSAVGNINALGNIVGDNLTKITQISDITTVGDTSFGDTITDTHTFNGHITASGNISSSRTLISNEINTIGHITASGNISGSATSTFKIGGKLQAGSKSFLIPRPEGGKLEYGALEGQQNDVFYRGELKGNNVIHLPKEWEWLVDENTITVQLTSIGKHQELYVKEIKDNEVFIDISGMFKTKEKINCYYIIHGTRKDIELIRNYQ